MTEERWLPIPSWEDKYEVSDAGMVRSVDGRILTPFNYGRYLAVSLDGRKDYRAYMVGWYPIAYLVLTAFVGPRPDKYMCLHEDDDPHNNAVTNLYYGTHSHNAADAYANGAQRPIGELCGSARLTEAQVLEAMALHDAGWTYTRLGDRYGVNRATVHYAVTGHTWKHLQKKGDSSYEM
jgi:hypothetical protein